MYSIFRNSGNCCTDYDIAAAKQRIKAAKEATLNSFNLDNSQADFLETSAAEHEKIAALLREKPVSMDSVNPATAAGLVALAIEVAVIGLVAFIELFLKPTPLPALIKFNDKLIDWGLNNDDLQNLHLAASPSHGTVALTETPETAPSAYVRGGGETVSVQAEHFQAWLGQLLSGKIKPTVKATKAYLRNTHGFKMEDAQLMAGEYLERAYNLGYLDFNDEQGSFAAQYKLADKKLLGQGG